MVRKSVLIKPLPAFTYPAFRQLNTHFLLFAVLLIVAATGLWAQPQNIKFTHLSVEQGLSSSSVFAISQTDEGFLWVGTQNGLHRYDGYSFKVFNFIPADTTSLSNNWVKALCTDRSGNLWVGTSNGLNRYNRTTEKFGAYLARPGDPGSIADNNIWSLYCDAGGTVWIGTNNGLSRYNPAQDRFDSYQITAPGGPVNNAINAIAEDQQGILWAGTWGGGLYRFDRQRGTFTSFATPTGATPTAGQFVKALKFDRNGRLWIGTQGNGLHLYEPATGKYTVYKHSPRDNASLGDDAVLSLLEDSQGGLWIGTYNGGIAYYQDGKFIRFQSDILDPNSLHGTWITSLFEDRSGVIWSGHDNGLSKFAPKSQKFLLFRHNPLKANSPPKSNINVIFEDRDGLLWLGTWSMGLCSFDVKTGTFTRYEHSPDNPRSLRDNRIWGISEDAGGTLWIATSGGLDKFDKQSGVFRHDADVLGDATANAMQQAPLSYITTDKNGSFWIGTWGGGLYVHDPNRKRTLHLKHESGNPNSLSNDRVKHIFVDSRGTAWISTLEGGLNRLTLDDRDRPVFKHYQYNVRNTTGLGSNSPVVVFEDSKKRLWVGTEGSGLHLFDRQTEAFKHITTLGAVSYVNSVLGILEDKAGNLWLGTNRGIIHYYPRSGQARLYDISDGLQSNIFLTGHCKTRDGAMLFGGHNGFNLFRPEQFGENRFTPPVLINELRLFNKLVEAGRLRPEDDEPVLREPLHLSREIILTHKDYILSFGFTSLDFTAPHKNRYAYRLENFEDRWNYTDAGQRQATYTNLSPGEYIFTVKGTNSDGAWNEQPATLRVRVLPPWWQTWWAYTLYGLMAVGALLQLRQYTVRRERLKNELELERLESEKLHEVDQMKSQFFTNISHEFRTPLTLILGTLSEKADEAKRDPASEIAFKGKEIGVMHRNASRLLQLINQLLDLSRLEAGRLQLETVRGDLLAFLKSIVYSFSSLADSKQVQLVFSSPHRHLPALFDRDKIEKITSNLLSNAFKFTAEGGTVRVEVQVRPAGKGLPDTVEISVADTGIGIPADRIGKIFDRFYQVDGSRTRAQDGTGIGLALTRELVLLHKGEIRVNSEEGKGTRFTVRLPLGAAYTSELEVPSGEPEEKPAAPTVEPQPAPAAKAEKMEESVQTAGEQDPLLLIVEDNEEVRRYICESFGGNYRVIEAEHGVEGLRKAVEAGPDLVISDLMMPRMDGLELCRHLKTDERTSHIPVILLTARASVESKLDGLETGADDYVTKPFHPQELRARVRNLIDGRKNLRIRFAREVKLQPRDITVTSADERFLQNAIAVVEKHMGNSDFSVEALETEMSMSKMQLYRKLKALTDQSPSEFVRTLRLKRAASLIAQRSGNISEIAYEVGFNNLSYFAKCFKEMYGVPPSEYANPAKDVVT
jgi:signal transduction histidine kinase/ligand-binding sensor domain-containing protein/DNA-binding response OmpR family regulator